jgi:23S rRNA (guanosine2251-2'-O)-methyltransferase
MSAVNNYIFGIRSIIEAINAGKEIDKVLIKKGLTGDLSKELIDLLRENNVNCQYVPIERIDRITRKNHQGVLAFISAIEYQSLENTLISVFERGEVPLVVVLDSVTDVRNMGAIARSAECAGVHAIVVPEKGSAVVNADAIKTSAGALHDIPVCRVKSLDLAIKYLKNSGLTIACASEKGGQNYFNCNLSGPLAIVMGAEDTGISTALLKYADVTAKIPLMGKIGSLNVSVAAGILLFETVKQRLETPNS